MPRRCPTPTLSALAIVPGFVACLAALLMTAIAPEFADRAEVQWAPWAVGLLLFGIPHGAMDHRVGLEARPGRSSPGIGFFIGYLALMGLVLICWWMAPMAALVGFLAVAAFHFGQGDLYWSRAVRAGIGPDGSVINRRVVGWPAWRAALTIAVRGLVPVALPVLVFHDVFAEAADAMAGRLFGASGRWEIPPAARWSGLSAIGILVALELVALAVEATRRPDRRRVALREAGGTALLIGLFALVPPVLAMGVYFNAWHSVRHVARLLPVAGPTREPARIGRWGEALSRFHLATLPTTLAALAMMGALWWVLRDRVGSSADLGLAALAMVGALTLPHVLVVLGMDRAQEVWGRSSSTASPGEVGP